MKGLLSHEEALTAQRDRQGSTCSVRLLTESLDPVDQRELEAMLADRTIYGSTIADLCKNAGLLVNNQPVSADTFNRHRKEGCRCQARS